MTDWKAKLLAYLHDPPDKAYDYGPKHKQRAEAFKNRVLGEGVWQAHEPDWEAAAADRFIFPDGKKLNELDLPALGGGVQFKHPLSGRLALLNFPTAEVAGDIISSVLPEFEKTDEQAQHWLLWRCWLHFAVTHAAGRHEGAETLAYLPADTRIPDGSIWHHNAVVSALEAARGNDGKLHPAFLLFQIGPVQEFIAQARSTRDLWSGSYLLSWMIARAIHSVTEKLGPDNIIYPSLLGQPLFDWLNQQRLRKAHYGGEARQSFWDSLGLQHSQDLVLTPNLPNRFLAVVPEDFPVAEVETAFKEGWGDIVKACWNYFAAQGCPLDAKRDWWEFQVAHFWQVSWQLWPWQSVDETMRLFANIPNAQASNLFLAKQVAEAIPDAHKDSRNYPLVRGWAWSAHYQLTTHRHDACRQTRHFAPWQITVGVRKDSLSGKEEALVDEEWLAKAQAAPDLKHLFRKGDRLGAINLVKRVWHKAYLEKLSQHCPGLSNLSRVRTSFDSVPAIAATPWLAQLRERLGEEQCRNDFVNLTRALEKCREHLADVTIPDAIKSEGKLTESDWLEKADAQIFHASFWQDIDAEAAQRPEVKQAAQSMGAFKRNHNLGEPPKYYAVLAMDGDQIGKWLSGEKTPAIDQVITPKAAQYFRDNVRDADVAGWLKSHRPLSPSYHLQFSEALANFGLYCARRVVEAHHGQLIYSGGDDVLAMLPASEAVACAQGLRQAFQGSTELPKKYPALFADAPEGFIRLKDGDRNKGARRSAEPSWPLLVPGQRADISAGIAIGHMHNPLQNLVEAAREAEKRAKDKYRDKNAMEAGGAFAISLFKRSGETIQWGAKWDSKAIELTRSFAENSGKDKPISGRFPYALADLLRKYDTPTRKENGEVEPFKITETADFNPLEVFPADFSHVAKQQSNDKLSTAAKREEFCQLAKTYLEECRGRRLDDFLGPFLTTAFITRGGGE